MIALKRNDGRPQFGGLAIRGTRWFPRLFVQSRNLPTRLIYFSCGQGLKGELAMPIIRLLQNEPFGPEDVKIISAAYEQTLSSLGLVDRTDPITEIVAKKIRGHYPYNW